MCIHDHLRSITSVHYHLRSTTRVHLFSTTRVRQHSTTRVHLCSTTRVHPCSTTRVHGDLRSTTRVHDHLRSRVHQHSLTTFTYKPRAFTCVQLHSPTSILLKCCSLLPPPLLSEDGERASDLGPFESQDAQSLTRRTSAERTCGVRVRDWEKWEYKFATLYNSSQYREKAQRCGSRNYFQSMLKEGWEPGVKRT